jgi:uncharacterized protein (TIGR03437 family)
MGDILRRLAVLGSLTSCPMICLHAQDRIAGQIDSRQSVVLKTGIPTKARQQFDRGLLDPARPMNPVALFLKPSDAQQAALEQLLEAQRNPSSPSFHRWLTPEQFADRFGASAADLAKISTWLQSQGLKIEHSARGRNWIAFSGTAGAVGKAFRTEIHQYQVDGETHFANATAPSMPAALEPMVRGLVGLDDFRPVAASRHAMIRTRSLSPQATSGTGAHYLAPDDFATIYDIAPLYAAGLDGTGQTIAIPGESDVDLRDIRAFRSGFNLSANDPKLVLFGQDPGTNNELLEADLDIEWVGAVARNASIVYVYARDSRLAAYYAIDQNYGSVLSYSFADCETIRVDETLLFQAMVQQANAQGTTFVAGSGDSGAASCDAHDFNPIATNGISAPWPGTIPEVTSVGGTTFNEGSGSYWGNATGSNGAAALSYIPEVAWNDTAAEGVLAASGGGASVLYTKPSWQAGPGVPNDNARDAPDVALAASSIHDGYAGCSAGVCFVVGGTSITAPAFAGMLGLVNHAVVSKGGQAGLGNINPMLYRLARNTSGVFHDITSGNNVVPCAVGTPNCSTGTFGYSAGPGYDLVTGLGSLDLNNLVMQWNPSPSATTVTVTAAPAGISLSASTQLTVTVTPASGGAAPTGTVSFAVENQAGEVIGGQSAPQGNWLGTIPLNASGGTATATLSVYGGQLSKGPNTIAVVYSGDGNYSASAVTVSVTTTVPSSNSAVGVLLSPNPVGEQPPDSNGNRWIFAIQLTERAGVATTLTKMTIGGVDYSSKIASFFGTTTLPANGTLSTVIGNSSLQFPSTVAFGFGGQDAGGFQWNLQAPLQFDGPVEVRLISAGGLANGASFQAGFAPGMVLSVFGVELAQSTTAASSLPLPISLDNTTATVNGVPAPFYFASPNQINVQIPYETNPGIAVLAVTSFGETFSYSFVVSPSAPGIFVGQNNATVPFASGSRGQTYTLFITGEGGVTPALATGATPASGTPANQLPQPKLPVSMTIGGVPATIVFVGIPTGLAGVTQINFTVPSNAPLGAEPVVVTVGNVSSPPATFTVTQ